MIYKEAAQTGYFVLITPLIRTVWKLLQFGYHW